MRAPSIGWRTTLGHKRLIWAGCVACSMWVTTHLAADQPRCCHRCSSKAKRTHKHRRIKGRTPNYRRNFEWTVKIRRRRACFVRRWFRIQRPFERRRQKVCGMSTKFIYAVYNYYNCGWRSGTIGRRWLIVKLGTLDKGCIVAETRQSKTGHCRFTARQIVWTLAKTASRILRSIGQGKCL